MSNPIEKMKAEGDAAAQILKLAILDEYPILRFFQYEHLPEKLQGMSRGFALLAWEAQARARERGAPNKAEVAAGLRKLLEAKDCFVRSIL